jgi:hypothetical protein
VYLGYMCTVYTCVIAALQACLNGQFLCALPLILKNPINKNYHSPAQKEISPAFGPDRVLVWSDEFEGTKINEGMQHVCDRCCMQQYAVQ